MLNKEQKKAHSHAIRICKELGIEAPNQETWLIINDSLPADLRIGGIKKDEDTIKELESKSQNAYKAGVNDGRKQVQDDIDACERLNRSLENVIQNLSGNNGIALGMEVIDNFTFFRGIVVALTTHYNDSTEALVQYSDESGFHSQTLNVDRLREVN